MYFIKLITMKSLMILSLVLIAACVQQGNISNDENRNTEDLGGFCGWSTNAGCAVDSDCNAGGCSGQVCEGNNEGTITTCEYRDCYNADAYGVKCGCINEQCK